MFNRISNETRDTSLSFADKQAPIRLMVDGKPKKGYLEKKPMARYQAVGYYFYHLDGLTVLKRGFDVYEVEALQIKDKDFRAKQKAKEAKIKNDKIISTLKSPEKWGILWES